MNTTMLILISVVILVADVAAGLLLFLRMTRAGKTGLGIALLAGNLLMAVLAIAAVWYFLAPPT